MTAAAARVARLLAMGLLAALLLAAPAQARDAHQQARIEHLIAATAALPGAMFVRNGRAYDAARAAAHLRQKLDYAGDSIATAEDFIERCATASWYSGQRYRIRFADGSELDAAAYLQARLRAFDAARADAPHRY